MAILLELYTQLDAKVEELDDQIEECVRGINPPMLSIPGIGASSTAVILSEYGDFSKFNEINGELVTIMSDGMIVYCHELYCEYHGYTKIITNFNVDAYDFTDVICDTGIRKVLTSNGAKL